MEEPKKECPACTGSKDPWDMFNYCDEHDVCVDCKTHRKDIVGSAWGVCIGSFRCSACTEQAKLDGIKERKEAGFSHDFTDEVVCPHCGAEWGDSWELSESDENMHCEECDQSFSMERHVDVTYVTVKK